MLIDRCLAMWTTCPRQTSRSRQWQAGDAQAGQGRRSCHGAVLTGTVQFRRGAPRSKRACPALRQSAARARRMPAPVTAGDSAIPVPDVLSDVVSEL